MSSSSSLEEARSQNAETDELNDSSMAQRRSQMLAFWHQYKNVFEVTKFSKSAAFRQTEHWIGKTEYVDDKTEENRIETREEFFRSEFAQCIIHHGIHVYEAFNRHLDQASDCISKASRERWTKRFYDEKVSFAAKKYWIENQLPYYVDAWKKNEKDRNDLTREPGFKDLIATYPEFAILQGNQKERFLDLHFDQRKNLLKEARAALVSINSGQSGYYKEAKSTLYAAVSKGVLSAAKVGVWLQRIFKRGWSGKHIETFIRGGIPNSLPILIERWTKVKERFDNAMKKARERGEDLDARGYPMLTDDQFLNLPFEQRIHYVNELESRLSDAKNVANEKPIFLRIRHAMDTKDWEDASMLIAQAKADPDIQGKDRTRLLSMESYCRKFATNRRQEGSMEQVVSAKKRMDVILQGLGQSHSELAPLVGELSKGMYGNRSLHYFRWIVYNNKWCRGRGYLNDHVARKGASKMNEKLTKTRALQGEDIGRHDVISYETADEQFIRKKEKANHKATYRHVNVKDGAAVNKTKEWLSREQDPKVLYWTTFCAHEDGEPKSEGWHNDLLNALTELRGLSRTLDAAGVVYNGSNDVLTSKGVASKTLAA